MAPTVSNERKVLNPKNRQTKVHLIFDEKARKQYLTGFRKRKLERKRKYNEKLQKELKEERKRLQTELRAKIKQSASMKVVPEIEHLVPKEDESSEDEQAKVYELEDHTVTIQPIGDSQMQDENLYLGPNKGTKAASHEGDEEDPEAILDRKKKLKELNREATKKLQKTKAYKKQMQLVRTKSKKKAKAKRIQKKNVKGKRKK